MFAATRQLMTSVGLPPPTITAISPTSAVTAQWFTLTVTGTNFLSGNTTVFVPGSAVGPDYGTPIVVNSAGTSLTVNVYPYSDAAARAVTVTTPYGSVTSTQTFSSSTPPPPIILTSLTADQPRGTGYIRATGTNISGCVVYWQVLAGTQSIWYDGAPGWTWLDLGGPFFLWNQSTGGGTGWLNP